MFLFQIILSKCVYLVFVVLCSQRSVQAKFSKNITPDNCVDKRTCHECIKTSGCAWCLQPDISAPARCFRNILTDVCPKNYIWNPQSTQELSVNENLTIAGSSKSNTNIVQIRPQRVSLKLRINEIYSLSFRYSQAHDYPLDLYYIMDLSNSMEDDRKNLSILSDLLADTMRNITSKFRLGFGSFVDKVLAPFVSAEPNNLKKPCPNCTAPYGFKNIMPLSTDIHRFATEVKNATMSGNMDNPEGGFDAIMQIIACREIIGWREHARSLLLFTSDNAFHYAGDGKLGGVIEPNDGECHLNEDGLYTHAEIQDYPSIAQINRQVKEKSINVIFAVTASHISVYKKLSQHIEGASAATLSEDSSNVVDLVKEEYDKIFSSIEMKDNATGHVEITYHSNCLNGGSEIPTSKCDGLKVGDIVTFTAKILVKSCPTEPAEWNQIIQIYPVGINESLVIDLKMLCSCPCENDGSIGYQEQSAICNKHGTLMCGMCECDDTHFGGNCECSAVDSHFKKDRDVRCRTDNVTIDCNGRGYCLCGVCQCETRSNPHEIISGHYCECDNFSCDRYNQMLCSGPDHGVCECGSCVCKPRWTGTSCNCQISNDTCILPHTGEICSGRGKCECGVCKCKSTKDGRYSGKFCEKCSTCSNLCHELRNCVQCQMYKTGPLKENSDCSANCTAFITEPVQKVEIDEQNEENICIFYDENDCKFTFKYSEKKEIIHVYAELKLECPTKVFIIGLVGGVIAAIVFIGLSTLFLWKILTSIHDRREFTKFEKERKYAKWNEGGNPIFTPATTKFENPTYSK